MGRVKNPPAMQKTQVLNLGWEDPLEKEMATHSSILACKIPWTEEPGGLQSMALQESDVTEQLNHQRVQGEILRLERQTENQLIIVLTDKGKCAFYLLSSPNLDLKTAHGREILNLGSFCLRSWCSMLMKGN